MKGVENDMVNVNKLKGKIVECGMSNNKFAEAIGMNAATLYRKFNDNGENFTVAEVDIIVKLLGLSWEEATAIFFSQFVA